MQHNHPNCPPAIQSTIATEVCRREWQDVTIGQAFGIVIDGHVRHQMTDYDSLYKIPGLTREEARIIVQPEVLAIIASWAAKPTDT